MRAVMRAPKFPGLRRCVNARIGAIPAAWSCESRRCVNVYVSKRFRRCAHAHMRAHSGCVKLEHVWASGHEGSGGHDHGDCCRGVNMYLAESGLGSVCRHLYLVIEDNNRILLLHNQFINQSFLHTLFAPRSRSAHRRLHSLSCC